MFERFTQRARAALIGAQLAARNGGDPYLGSGHILIGLIADDESVAGRVLRAAGVTRRDLEQRLARSTEPVDEEALAAVGIDYDQVRAITDENFGAGALERAMSAARTRRSPYTPAAKQILEGSLREALRLKHSYIGTEHLLLAIVAEEDSLGSRTLRALAPDTDFRALVMAHLSALSS